MAREILFIGSFLSASDGSLSYGESLRVRLASSDIECRLVSHSENRIFRILEIVWAVLLFRGKIIHIDVFSNMAFRIAEIAGKVAFIRQKKIILTLRGGKLSEFADNNTERFQKLFKKSAHIQTPSLFLKNYFENAGYKIFYMPNAVDLSRFTFDRKSKIKYSLLWVRAFTEIYNPDIAIKSFMKVLTQFPAATLTMVGPDKGIMNEMRELASELQVDDKITFTGPVPNDNLNKMYHSHEVFLNTTSFESFGNAVIEAAACGIPIVSSRVGEIPYLWEDRQEILMVDELKPEAFAEKIIELFKNRDLAEMLSTAARKKAETFDWERIKPQWIKILSDG